MNPRASFSTPAWLRRGVKHGRTVFKVMNGQLIKGKGDKESGKWKLILGVINRPMKAMERWLC
jgi:hypothetical protein